jgi:hypothetical protein
VQAKANSKSRYECKALSRRVAASAFSVGLHLPGRHTLVVSVCRALAGHSVLLSSHLAARSHAPIVAARHCLPIRYFCLHLHSPLSSYHIPPLAHTVWTKLPSVHCVPGEPLPVRGHAFNSRPRRPAASAHPSRAIDNTVAQKQTSKQQEQVQSLKPTSQRTSSSFNQRGKMCIS